MAAAVMTIGNFDGVHVGHRRILARGRAEADRRGGRLVAMTFEPHPLSVLRPHAAPPRLTTAEQRADLLRAAGVDDVITAPADPALLKLDADAFVDRVISEHRPAAFVEGRDFRFGAGRRGDMALLAARGGAAGFDVIAVDPVEVVLSDLLVATASSSLCRWLLAHGRVLDAAVILGRPFSLTATVVQGEQRGRTIGFPTTNLDPAALAAAMLPAEGVYAGTALIAPLSSRERLAASSQPGEGASPDHATYSSNRTGPHRESRDALTPNPSPGGQGEPEARPAPGDNGDSEVGPHPAAISVGFKPTFRGRDLVIEAHLPGFDAHVYGRTVTLTFARHLREQRPFPSLDALRAQLARDVAATVQLHRAGLLEGPPPLVPMEAPRSSAPVAR